MVCQSFRNLFVHIFKRVLFLKYSSLIEMIDQFSDTIVCQKLYQVLVLLLKR